MCHGYGPQCCAIEVGCVFDKFPAYNVAMNSAGCELDSVEASMASGSGLSSHALGGQ